MELGVLIAKARKDKGLTQSQLAERLGVSAEAVSKWETGGYRPGGGNLDRLEEILRLSWYDENGEMKSGRIFDEEHMSSFLKGKFASGGFPEAQKALLYAKEKHSATKPRKGPGKVPYISHPLTMTCHALAMGLEDDVLLASLLLHDVVEECGISPDDLPFGAEVRKIVTLVSKSASGYDPDKYFDGVASEPKACLVKCIDRCNNLGTMASGFTRKKIAEYIRETEERYPRLLKVIKEIPSFNNAAWLLRYQMKCLLETAKKIG